MRTASIILGITSGCVLLLIALFIMFGGAMFKTIMPALVEDEAYMTYAEADVEYLDKEEILSNLQIASNGIFIWGGITLVGATLGIVGGALAKKHHILAGIMMLLGSLISIVSMYGIMASVLLLLGGIFALVREKPRVSGVDPQAI